MTRFAFEAFLLATVVAWLLVPVSKTASAQQRDPNAVYKVPLSGHEPWKGVDDALVTIVEFGDFEDPFSARAAPTLDQVVKKYSRYVRIVWMNNPLRSHPHAMLAAAAALEAYAQKGNDGFWAMHDKLFANQRGLNRAKLEGLAQELGLDMTRFSKALDEKKHESTIQRQQQLATALGAGGTPNFFINGRNNVVGARPLETFAAAVDEELAKARKLVASGTPRSQVYAASIANGHTEPVVLAPPPLTGAGIRTPQPTQPSAREQPTPSVNPEREGAFVGPPGVDPAYFKLLPSASAVIQANKGVDAKDTALRQVAHLQLLTNSIESLMGEFPLITEPRTLAVEKYREFAEAGSRIARGPEFQAGVGVLGYNPYPVDKGFRDLVVRSLPEEYQRFLRRAIEGPIGMRRGQVPKVDRQYLDPLPTLRELNNALEKSGETGTLERQVAALTVMMDYVLVVAGVEAWYASLYLREYAGFRDARSALAEQAKGPLRYQQYSDSPEFRRQVLRMLSEKQRNAYWAVRSPTGREPTVKSAEDDGRYAKQKARARSKGLDLNVFGIELYAPLDLPECPETNQDTLIVSAISGAHWGSKETCVGNDLLTPGSNIFMMAATAARGRAFPYKQVPVSLSKAKCPIWVQASRACAVYAFLVDGYVLGIGVPTGTTDDAQKMVIKQLNKKYGSGARDGDDHVTCRHPDTGILLYSGNNIEWPLDGLYVSYSPVAPTCLQGFVKVLTPELRQRMEKHEAAEPEM
jgi:protein-disulfide isomerase